jgi:hypothetical protein
MSNWTDFAVSCDQMRAFGTETGISNEHKPHRAGQTLTRPTVVAGRGAVSEEINGVGVIWIVDIRVATSGEESTRVAEEETVGTVMGGELRVLRGEDEFGVMEGVEEDLGVVGVGEGVS